MKIINLIEDTKGKEGYAFEHGLSFYVETKKHKLLFDTGASSAFIKNAEKLGLDLSKIDTVILSHGHYDHTGGLLDFVSKNPNVKIYMQKSAGLDYYNLKENREKYIGINKEILNLPQLVLLEGDYKIDEELFIFSNIKGRRFWAKSNLMLKEKINDEFKQDDFSHEQCLAIELDNKKILFSGCAHNGILNIIDRYTEIFKAEPNLVISGFHMAQKAEYTKEDISIIEASAKELNRMNTLFYTGHCTGDKAFELMKEIMKDKLIYMHSGDIIVDCYNSMC